MGTLSLISSDGLINTEIASRTARTEKILQRMKQISIDTRRRALECYIELNHSDVWMQGLDNSKTIAKEIGGYNIVVPMENATNLMDCKEIKQNSVTRK